MAAPTRRAAEIDERTKKRRREEHERDVTDKADDQAEHEVWSRRQKQHVFRHGRATEAVT